MRIKRTLSGMMPKWLKCSSFGKPTWLLFFGLVAFLVHTAVRDSHLRFQPPGLRTQRTNPGGDGRDNSISALTNPIGGLQQVNDEERYIYSAFLDRRFRTPYVRMFGMQTHNVTSEVHCRFTYGSGKIDLPPERSYAIFPQWPSRKLQYHAYYYGCFVPKFIDLTQNVTFSIFVQGSRSTTTLDLMQVGKVPDEKRGQLAVCVKALWGKMDPFRLVEWIETNRFLGVEKFVVYDRTVVGPSARVLEYYSRSGVVEIIPFTYALSMAYLMEDDPMKEKLAHDDMVLEQVYLVSINDCYYRFRDQFRHILLIDLDELVVPTPNENLISMIERTKQNFPTASAFSYPVAWHFEQFGEYERNAPKYMYTQRFLKRTPVMSSQPKTIFDTDRAMTLNWHSVIMMPSNRGYTGNVDIPWKQYGFTHHYRKKCRSDPSKCAVMLQMAEVDDIIPRLRSSVQPQVEHVLRENGLL